MTTTEEAWRAKDPLELIELEGNVIPEGEIRIISYLSEEGEELYAFTTTEGMRISGVIGMLGMVEHVLQHRAESDGWPNEEDER